MKGEEFTVTGNEWNAFIYLTWNFLDYTFGIRLQRYLRRKVAFQHGIMRNENTLTVLNNNYCKVSFVNFYVLGTDY